MPIPESTSKDIVERYTEDGYNAHDPEVIADCITEDVVMHGLIGVDGALQGREAYLEWGAGLLEAFPDAHIEVEDVLAEGNTVATRWTITGTHEGALGDIPATGNSIEISALSLFRIENGKIAEKWFRPDGLGLMQQLGIVEQPEA